MSTPASRHLALLATQDAFNRLASRPDALYPDPLQDALRCLVEGAAACLPAAERITIALRDGDALVIRAGNATPAETVRVPLAGSLHAACLDAGEPLHLPDTRTQGWDGTATADGSLLLVPFQADALGAGVLQLGCSRPHGFDEDDVLLGQLLGGILAAAVRRLAGSTPPLPDIFADRLELLDADDRVLWINLVGLRLQGQPDAPASIGSSWLDGWSQPDRVVAAAAVAAARSGGVGRFRTCVGDLTSVRRCWDVVITPMPAATDAGRLLALGRDITDLDRAARRNALALKAGSVIGIGTWRRTGEQTGDYWLDEELADAFGLPADRLQVAVPADFLRCVHPDDQAALRAFGREARARGGEPVAKFRLRATPVQSGAAAWRWVEARAHTEWRDGVVDHSTGVLIDIDGRRRAELELAQNQQTIRHVAESLPILIVHVAPDLSFRFANRAYRRCFGEAGASVRSLFGAAIEQGQRPLLERALGGERIRFDTHARGRDGLLRDLDLEYIPRRAADGAFDGCYVIGIDITGRKEEERALSRSRLTLEQSLAVAQQESERVWRLSRELLCVRDQQWRLRSVNPAWSAALGWPAESLLGDDTIALIHPDDRARSLAIRQSLSRDGDSAAYESRYRASSGAYRWLSWNLVSADGLIYATARDVTDEKEAALRVQRIEEQLRQSQKMEAVGQLTGGIAHDFNNLLTGVIGSLEMMRNRVGQGRLDDLGKYMDAAAESAERAASVTHRLLSFSRRQTLEPKPVLADGLIDEMDPLIRRAAAPVAVLQIVRHRGLWTIFCDPRQLEIAVLNLVNNARDAMPNGGRLMIETANAVLEDDELGGELPAREYVAISVSDTGIGMSTETAARAFDPFFTTKPIGRGTGLGLSMVYGFARQSGGHARIVSAPGRGARVTIYLPRSTQANAVATSTARAAPAVLLVEDEPMVRMLVGEALGELDCDTIEAVDGAGGLRVLQSERVIDLLITDIGLPGGMDGVQMVELARAQRPDLKVLFITGYAESSIPEATSSSATMEVIGKPFTLELLMERVRAMIQC